MARTLPTTSVRPMVVTELEKCHADRFVSLVLWHRDTESSLPYVRVCVYTTIRTRLDAWLFSRFVQLDFDKLSHLSAGAVDVPCLPDKALNAFTALVRLQPAWVTV